MTFNTIKALTEPGISRQVTPRVNALLELQDGTYETTTYLPGSVLVAAGEAPTCVYFPLDGMLSIVLSQSSGVHVEVGVVGPEGCAPIGLTLNGTLRDYGTEVQLGGIIAAMPVERFEALVASNERFRDAVNAFVESLLDQVMRVSACRAIHSVQQRLARWLLMAQDRVRSDDLSLTQTMIGDMLGVSRQIVNSTLAGLRNRGALDVRRSGLYIVNREELRAASCSCYDGLALEKELP